MSPPNLLEGARFAPPRIFCASVLSDRDLLTQVDVLNDVQELYALRHRPLEGLAPTDEPCTAGALVDACRDRRLGEVVLARWPTGVDEPSPPHEAVGDLVPGEVDRVVAGELGVDAFVQLAVRRLAGIQCLVTAIHLGQLL